MSVIAETIKPVNLIQFPQSRYPGNTRSPGRSTSGSNNEDGDDDMLMDHQVYFSRNKALIDNKVNKLKDDYINKISDPEVNPEEAFGEYHSRYADLAMEKTRLNIEEMEAKRFYKDDVKEWRKDVIDKDIGGNVVVTKGKDGSFVPVVGEKGLVTYDDYYSKVSSEYGNDKFVKPELFSTIEKDAFEESIENNIGDIKTNEWFKKFNNQLIKKESNIDDINKIKDSFYQNLNSDQRKALASDYYTQGMNQRLVEVKKDDALKKDGKIKKGYREDNGKYYRQYTQRDYALNKLSQHLAEKSIVKDVSMKDISGNGGGINLDNVTIWDQLELGMGESWEDAEIQSLPSGALKDLQEKVLIMERAGAEEEAIENMVLNYHEENYPEIIEKSKGTFNPDSWVWAGNDMYQHESTGRKVNVKEFETMKKTGIDLKEISLVDISNIPMSKTEKQQVRYMNIPASLSEKASNTYLVNKDLSRGPNPKMYLNNYPVNLSDKKNVIFDNPEIAYQGFKSSEITDQGIIKGKEEVRAGGRVFIPLEEAEGIEFGSKTAYFGGEFPVGKDLLDGKKLSDEAEDILKGAEIVRVKDMEERFKKIYLDKGYDERDKIVIVPDAMVPWQAPKLGGHTQTGTKKEFLKRAFKKEMENSENVEEKYGI